MKKRNQLTHTVKEKVASKPFRFRVILILTATLCLILSLVSFSASVSLKRNNLTAIGERAIDTGRGVAISLRTFQPDKLLSLLEKPEENDSYRVLSSYLNEIKIANGYKYLFLIAEGNNGYFYLADANFTENPSHIAGKDYLSIGTAFKPADFGKKASTLLSEIYNKTTVLGYTKNIINHKKLGAFTCAFIPILDNSGDIICTLAIANNVDTVLVESFIIRSLNILAFASLIAFVILALWVTLLLMRDKRQEAKALLKNATEPVVLPLSSFKDE